MALDSSQPAMLNLRPPRGSAASMWLFPSDNIVLSIQCDIRAIVQIDVEYLVYQDGMPNAPSGFTIPTSNNANPGQLAQFPLDVAAGGTYQFIPVGTWQPFF